ncbi:UbiA family prenyltransferase [Candidatus Bathyarchaeota archaeon]|nr:UbiA family prenyltransferase [Candidatus Bathyarchaeota archaeon]
MGTHSKNLSKLKGFLKIIRPLNSIMLGFSILVGILISNKQRIYVPLDTLIFAYLSGFTLTGSAMVINDYFDYEIDLINEPKRPLPSGIIKKHEALFFSFLLSIFGVFFSYLNGISTFLIALFAWIMMMLYSSFGKKMGFIGNLMVSSCISLPFIYGGIIVSNLTSSLLFGLIAFLSNTGREVTKGIVDIDGDGKKGIRTIAVNYGAKTAAYFSVILYLSATITSVFPVLFNYVSFWYIPFVLVTDLGLIYISINLIKNYSRENSRKMKNLVLYCMFFGLLGFTAGSIF